MTARPPKSRDESDALYADLVAAHAGLSEQASARLNARLILILMSSHVSTDDFRAALAEAKTAVSVQE